MQQQNNNTQANLQPTFTSLPSHSLFWSYDKQSNIINVWLEQYNAQSTQTQTNIQQSQDKIIGSGLTFTKIQQINQTRSLVLSGCHINDQIFKQIIKQSKWENLAAIDISQNQITEQTIDLLAQRKLASLTSIVLSNNNIGNKGFETIINWNYPKLNQLKIQKANLLLDQFKLFKQFKSSNLSILNLSGNKLGNNGVNLLVKADLPGLRQIRLDQCQIGSKGWLQLTKNQWKNLQVLSMTKNLQSQQYFKSLYLNDWTKLKTFLIGAIQKQQNCIFIVNCIIMKSNVLSPWILGASMNYELSSIANNIFISRFFKQQQ